MFEYHKDKDRYFQMQYLTTRDYIIPFLQDHFEFTKTLDVLEIGCAEAGVLQAFTEQGHKCLGIELSESRTEHAKRYHNDNIKKGLISFLNKNIYDIDVDADLETRFDLVILKDVIEHIPDQARFIPKLKDFLKPNGKVFFAFPPWYMPFGGHQQICRSKLLSKLPYIHLLPKPLYSGMIKMANEPTRVHDELLEIKDTGISIERFERIVKQAQFRIFKEQPFLFNPIYKYKFNLEPRTQIGLINALPHLRNYFTTATYYLIGH